MTMNPYELGDCMTFSPAEKTFYFDKSIIKFSIGNSIFLSDTSEILVGNLSRGL